MSSPLEQRPFGRTGERVTVIGLGGAALYKHSYEQGVATVKHALDLGVNYFDTSPAYGRADEAGWWTDRGMSQLIMGEGLEGTSKPHLLATKLVNYTTEVRHAISRAPNGTRPLGWRTLDGCRAQLQDNLRALRRDRVDVLLGHSIQGARAWIPEAEARDDDQRLDLDAEIDFGNTPLVRTLREAKAQGTCRYIGLSGDESTTLAHVLNRVELDMCLSAGEYTPLDRRSPRIVAPVVRAQGIAYVVGGIFRGAGSGRARRRLAVSTRPRRCSLSGRIGIRGCAPHQAGQDDGDLDRGVDGALPARGPAKWRPSSSARPLPGNSRRASWRAQAGPLPPDIHQTVAALSPSRHAHRSTAWNAETERGA